MNDYLRKQKHVRVPAMKRLPLPIGEGGGFRSVADGMVGWDIEITIDLTELFRSLGADAIRNSTKTAKLAGGIIVARALPGTRVRYENDGWTIKTDKGLP